MSDYDIDKVLESLLQERKREKPSSLLGGDEDKIVSIFDELLNKENKDGR